MNVEYIIHLLNNDNDNLTKVMFDNRRAHCDCHADLWLLHDCVPLLNIKSDLPGPDR